MRRLHPHKDCACPVTDFTGRVPRRDGRTAGRPGAAALLLPAAAGRRQWKEGHHHHPSKAKQRPALSLLHGRAPHHGLALARKKGKGMRCEHRRWFGFGSVQWCSRGVSYSRLFLCSPRNCFPFSMVKFVIEPPR